MLPLELVQARICVVETSAAAQARLARRWGLVEVLPLSAAGLARGLQRLQLPSGSLVWTGAAIATALPTKARTAAATTARLAGQRKARRAIIMTITDMGMGTGIMAHTVTGMGTDIATGMGTAMGKGTRPMAAMILRLYRELSVRKNRPFPLRLRRPAQRQVQVLLVQVALLELLRPAHGLLPQRHNRPLLLPQPHNRPLLLPQPHGAAAPQSLAPLLQLLANRLRRRVSSWARGWAWGCFKAAATAAVAVAVVLDLAAWASALVATISVRLIARSNRTRTEALPQLLVAVVLVLRAAWAAVTAQHRLLAVRPAGGLLAVQAAQALPVPALLALQAQAAPVPVSGRAAAAWASVAGPAMRQTESLAPAALVGLLVLVLRWAAQPLDRPPLAALVAAVQVAVGLVLVLAMEEYLSVALAIAGASALRRPQWEPLAAPAVPVLALVAVAQGLAQPCPVKSHWSVAQSAACGARELAAAASPAAAVAVQAAVAAFRCRAVAVAAAVTAAG